MTTCAIIMVIISAHDYYQLHKSNSSVAMCVGQPKIRGNNEVEISKDSSNLQMHTRLFVTATEKWRVLT